MSEVPNPRDRQQWPPRRPLQDQQPRKWSDAEFYGVLGGAIGGLIVGTAFIVFMQFVFPSIAAWFMGLK